MRKLLTIALIIGLTLGAMVAQADVIIKQKSDVSSMGMMEMTINSIEYVRPDRDCTEQTTVMTGGMAAMFGGQGAETKEISINRLDKGVYWDVNIDENSYTEHSLASYKETLEQQTEEESDEMMGEMDKYEWTTEIKTIDDPETISGFKCKGMIAEAKGVNKEDPSEKMEMTFEYWFTKDIEGYNVLKQYRENYSEATGIDMMSAQEEAGMFISKMGEEFGQMFEKMEEADGYPIKTVIVMKGVSSKMGQMGDEEMNTEGMPPEVKKMMEGMMEGDKSEDGMTTFFSVTNIVESIETGDVDDGKFEVPQGFTKY